MPLHTPVIQPIHFEVEGEMVSLVDIRLLTEVQQAEVGLMMVDAWTARFGESPKLDGTETQEDPHQTGFAVVSRSSIIGAGGILEVELEEDGPKVVATGKLLLALEGFPQVAAAILAVSQDYVAQAVPEDEYDLLELHVEEV